MMNSKNFMKIINNSDFVFSQLPLQIQLGIPYIAKRGKRLCLVFLPHSEVYNDGKIEIYDRQYELEIAYPSCHIVRFIDLTESGNFSTPIKIIDADWMAAKGKYVIDNIFSACAETLEFYDEYHTMPDVVLDKYCRVFKEAAEDLGIYCLYEVVV